MKRMFVILAVSMILAACAPVLNQELMREGIRNPSFNSLREEPDTYKGKIFIIGGLIVDTRLTEQGSQIEALYVPVDSYGNLIEGARIDGRFFATYSKEKGLLDPVVFRKGREITLAGEFVELKKGKIDEMEYDYPVFEIKQIHLWEEPTHYYYYYPYYYSYYPYYPDQFMYERWGRSYPDPTWWGSSPW
jgi:outer membrane lipoprotein